MKSNRNKTLDSNFKSYRLPDAGYRVFIAGRLSIGLPPETGNRQLVTFHILAVMPRPPAGGRGFYINDCFSIWDFSSLYLFEPFLYKQKPVRNY